MAEEPVDNFKKDPKNKILQGDYESSKVKMERLKNQRPTDYMNLPIYKELSKINSRSLERIKERGVVSAEEKLKSYLDVYNKIQTEMENIAKENPSNFQTIKEYQRHEKERLKLRDKLKSLGYDINSLPPLLIEGVRHQASTEEPEVVQKTADPVSSTVPLRSSPGPKLNQFTGKIMTNEEVSIAGEKFIIKYDEASRKRRSDIFLHKDDKQKLLPTEENVLKKLCITEDTYEAVRTYLYDFFEALPSCQSSVAILSNRQCEVAYYVLWSVLLKARQEVQRKIDDAKRKSEIDIKIHQYEARLKSMSMRNLIPQFGPKPCEKSHDEHVEIENLIKRLEGKLDSVQEKVNKMKGGGCRLLNSMMVGSEATHQGIETPPVTPDAATGLLQAGGNRLIDSMMVGYEPPSENMTKVITGGGLQELKRIYGLYA